MNNPQEFPEFRAALRQLEREGFRHGAALATLTRTKGSTFRRAGARMLVCGDGTVVRGLSGGCPEADIVARAKEVIAQGQARIVRYDREHGLDAMIELGCAGELEVLIEPLHAAADIRFLAPIEHCQATRTPGFVATVFARNGECLVPRPLRLVCSNGVARVDDLGNAALSAQLIAHGQSSVRAQAIVESVVVGADTFDVLLEHVTPPHALYVIGDGVAARALMRLGAQMGWLTTLVTHRPDLEVPADLPSSGRLVCVPPGDVKQKLMFDAHSSVVVMTFNLERDIDYLLALEDAPLAYLGGIGSRERCRKVREATGLAPPKLHAPAGLDIGSETPEEIALAIAAEILASRTGHAGGKLSASSKPIH
jgi:xanthine dehydrogenase accessory factor